MLNTNNNKAVNIGILEISPQNKAILEYFFSSVGKSVFKEVNIDSASAFIIDYDSLGAKESWEKTYNDTKKPGIIISIHEVNLPETVWIAKPLTTKALSQAGQKIRDMLDLDETALSISVVSNTPEQTPELVNIKQQQTESVQVPLNEEEIIVEKEVALAGIEFTDFETTSAPTQPTYDDNDTASQVTSDVKKDKEDSLDQVSLVQSPKNENHDNEIDQLLASLISGKGSQSSGEITTEIEQGTTPELEPVISDDSEDESVELGINNLESIDEALVVEEIDLIDEHTTDLTTPNDENIASVDDVTGIETKSFDTMEQSTEAEPVSNTIEQTIEIDIPSDMVIEEEDKNKEVSISTAMENENNPEDELQRLLEEIRNEADTSTLFQTVDTNGDASGLNNETFNTNAEKRWSLMCGDLIKITKTSELKKHTYNPDDHLVAIFRETLDTSRSSQQVMRLKLGRTIIIVDAMEETVFCDNPITEDAYASLCYEPINKDQIKIHALDTSEVRMILNKQESNPELSHSIDSFIWTASLLTSRGRLPKGTDLKQSVGLKHWPNLTRLESFPHCIQIAAVFKKNTGSLLEITNWLEHIPQSSIFAFYNGALALNLIEADKQKLQLVKGDLKKPSEIENRNRGFFSRLIKRITK